MGDHEVMGREWTPALVRRRLHDSEVTIARLRDRIALDPTSGRVPQIEKRIAELDLAIQSYRMELEHTEG